MLDRSFQEIIMILPALVIGFTFHEFAHAWVALRFGDTTALRLGRVTLNPLVHLDIMGSLLLLLAGFGWAKPVPVNVEALRPRVLGDIAVSLAGVVMNLLIAVIFTFLTVMSDSGFYAGYHNPVLTDTLWMVVNINILLAAFNLLPIPPLDGFRVARYLFPSSMSGMIDTVYRFGPFLLIILFISGAGWRYLSPAMQFLQSAIFTLFGPLLRLL